MTDFTEVLGAIAAFAALGLFLRYFTFNPKILARMREEVREERERKER